MRRSHLAPISTFKHTGFTIEDLNSLRFSSSPFFLTSKSRQNTSQMETEKSETPIQTTTKSATRSKPKTRNPKSKFKKSKSESASATIIYVPVLVQSIASDTSTAATTTTGKSRKAAQPVLNEQQMKDWRCQADDCTADANAVGRYYQRHRICPEHSKAPSVLFNGTQQRYCQQCSRYHI